METKDMSLSEFKKKKTEVFESYKYLIPTRGLYFGWRFVAGAKFRKEHKVYFFIDSFSSSRLYLSQLRKMYGENLENYEYQQVEHKNSGDALFIIEKIQLNRRIFSVNFWIEDDTANPIHGDEIIGVLGADFLVNNKAIIDYESRRLWIDK